MHVPHWGLSMVTVHTDLTSFCVTCWQVSTICGRREVQNVSKSRMMNRSSWRHLGRETTSDIRAKIAVSYCFHIFPLLGVAFSCHFQHDTGSLGFLNFDLQNMPQAFQRHTRSSISSYLIPCIAQRYSFAEVCGAGDIFGELALLYNCPRAVCNSDSFTQKTQTEWALQRKKNKMLEKYKHTWKVFVGMTARLKKETVVISHPYSMCFCAKIQSWNQFNPWYKHLSLLWTSLSRPAPPF